MSSTPRRPEVRRRGVADQRRRGEQRFGVGGGAHAHAPPPSAPASFPPSLRSTPRRPQLELRVSDDAAGARAPHVPGTPLDHAVGHLGGLVERPLVDRCRRPTSTTLPVTQPPPASRARARRAPRSPPIRSGHGRHRLHLLGSRRSGTAAAATSPPAPTASGVHEHARRDSAASCLVMTRAPPSPCVGDEALAHDAPPRTRRQHGPPVAREHVREAGARGTNASQVI